MRHRLATWTMGCALTAATLTACNLVDLGPLADAELPSVDFEVLGDTTLDPTPSTADHPIDKVVVVPRRERGSQSELGLLAGSSTRGRRTAFLNGAGGVYSPGWDNNSSEDTSTIVPWQAGIPAYRGGDAAWQRLVSCVQDQFAPFDIEITDRDPGAAPHIEAVIGGHPRDIGEGDGVGGIAPVYEDCGTVERAVVFVFEDVFHDERVLCEVTAHEIGHALGLEHAYLCEDPMTYLNGCGDKSFQDVDAQCGTSSPGPCMCGPTQNTYAFLMDRLGPSSGGSSPPPVTGGGDHLAPRVTIETPVPGDRNVSGPFTVQARVDDTDPITDLTLYWHYGGWHAFDCFNPPSDVACSLSGGVATWTFDVGWGARGMRIEATDSTGRRGESLTYSLHFEEPAPETGSINDAEITFDTPWSGQRVSAGEVLEVRAEAPWVEADEEVWLWWLTPWDEAAFKLNHLGGERYGLDLHVLPEAQGERGLVIGVYGPDDDARFSEPVWIEVE